MASLRSILLKMLGAKESDAPTVQKDETIEFSFEGESGTSLWTLLIAGKSNPDKYNSIYGVLCIKPNGLERHSIAVNVTHSSKKVSEDELIRQQEYVAAFIKQRYNYNIIPLGVREIVK